MLKHNPFATEYLQFLTATGARFKTGVLDANSPCNASRPMQDTHAR